MNRQLSSLRRLVIFGITLSIFGSLTASAAEEKVVALEGVVWTFIAPPAGSAAPTLEFNAEKKSVNGFAGINRFFGGYERNGDKLKFGALGSTQMGGEPAAMNAEQSFLTALATTTHWRIVEGKLELLQEDKIVARFSSRAAAPKGNP